MQMFWFCAADSFSKHLAQNWTKEKIPKHYFICSIINFKLLNNRSYYMQNQLIFNKRELKLELIVLSIWGLYVNPFTGISVDELCLHNGDCRNVDGAHRCICRTGFEGSYCDQEIDACSAHPCENDATCISVGNGRYVCECRLGYQGLHCEYDVNECASHPCMNGGTCHDIIGDFQCSCLHGTEGVLCEIDRDECNSDPCLNGGVCVDRINGFDCRCPGGFAGPRCEGDINECQVNPCSTEGALACDQTINGFRCICRRLWTGRLCDRLLRECPSNPCQNGGNCVLDQNKSVCMCLRVRQKLNYKFLSVAMNWLRINCVNHMTYIKRIFDILKWNLNNLIKFSSFAFVPMK